MAVPFELVVAVWVVVLPLGVVSVNVTLAPEAAVPPLVTDAVIGTLPGRVKLVPETKMLAASTGGVITVAFAVAEALEDVSAALTYTAYVPAGVPEGAPLPIVTEPDCPGLSVSEEAEREVDHPEGSLELRLIVLEEHPELSLFVTETE